MMNVDEVLRLIDQLYSSSSSKNEQEDADRKLQNFQLSPDAWNISLEILNRTPSTEAVYFASNTLRTKVQSNYKELPPNFREPLRDSLLQIIWRSNEKFSKASMSQLSVAVSHLALQSTTWPNSLVYLKDLVKADSEIRHVLTIVQILQYIPEDIDSKRLQLGENRRNELRTEFTQDAPSCLGLLSSLLSIQVKENVDIRLRVFKCLTSWLKSDIIHVNHLATDPVFLNWSFCFLTSQETDQEMHDIAADFLCAVVQASYNQAAPEELLCKIYDGVLTLRQPYHASVSAEDSDRATNFVSVFASTSEAFMDRIQSLPDSGVGNKLMLDILLDCCGHYDFEIAMHTFNFWFSFGDSVSRVNENGDTSAFGPYFERLTIALYRLCQLDPDRNKLLTLKDDFYEFRSLARDIIMESVTIVHPMKIISHMKDILENSASSWEQAEASVFVLSAVAKFIHREENEITPNLFKKVLQIVQMNGCHLCLDFSVLQLVGELGTWVNNHPQFLEALIQFLASRLSNPELNDGASNALLNICTSNAESLAPHFDTLCELLNYFDLQKQKSSDDLIQGLASILSHKDDIQLKQGITKLTKYLVSSANAKQEEKSSESMKMFLPTMDRLSILFQYARPKHNIPQSVEHPCREAILEALPVIIEVLKQYKSSEKATEKGCRTLRYALRNLGLHFDVCLASVVETVVELYAHNGFSCYLYLGGIIVDEFGQTQQYTPGLSALFEHFSAKALSQFAEEDGFRNHPDTVDDFFRLTLRIIQKCPDILFNSEKLNPVFQAATYGLHLEHREALISIVEFVDTLFSSAKESQGIRHRLSQLLISHGDEFILEAVSSAVFSLPRYQLADLSIVFQAVSQFDHDSYCLFMAHAFQNLAQREETRNKNVSEQQLRTAYDSIVSDSNHRNINRNLKNFVKFYR